MTPEKISRLADLLRLIDKDIPEEEGYNPYDPMEDCPTCGVWWQSEGATCSTCLAYRVQHDACLAFLKEFQPRPLADEVLRLHNKLDVLRAHRDRLYAEARSLDPCWQTAYVLTYEEVVDLLDAALLETP